MKKFLSVFLAVLITLSTISVLSVVTFADEPEPPVVEEELPKFPDLGTLRLSSILREASEKVAEAYAAEEKEIDFDSDEYKVAYANSVIEIIKNNYSYVWEIVKTSLNTEEYGYASEHFNVASMANVMQYIIDWAEHDTGIKFNSIPNFLRYINAQRFLGKLLNNIIAWVSTPLTASTTLMGKIATWFTETLVPFFNSLFGGILIK